MSASTKELNPFVKKDRAKVNDSSHFLYGEKGTVNHIQDISVYLSLDSGIEIITSFKNLKKIKKKK